ncbi:exonuclease domain-containing protein [Lutimonas zeaxanthinifaciens]|uniref:exonuclease domain-containing protein n=1 Tax=Lutimonas zeaxanthinifaciens TaxID=3060215 RepID=UPI00265D1049|nr:exonuclease domain-containing protein [Lutimonas sp. YSD2104]WKK67244.1 exonuclease domain-containing protein [Lutimonas sp. YSD2104]
MDFAIIDVETTGGKFNEEGITEIAIHRFNGIDITDTFISLINPEREIQPFVANLTGINNKMLRNAPKFYEVAKRLIEILEDCVLVAHNSSFDYRVIRNEFYRLGYDFEMPTLCTVELSKKLIPDLESYSLGKLCRTIGIPVSDRHRANGDAIATLKLFEILLQKDKEKLIVKKTIKEGNQRDLSEKQLKLLEGIPSSSGLFFFHRYNGEVLYVGKGKNMHSTVNHLFLKTSNRSRSLVKELSSVSFELTGSDLLTRLKFEEALSQHKPRFNRTKKMDYKLVSFNHENMILIDKGRNEGEKSVVLIENNQYQGYAYAELRHQFNNLGVLKKLIISSEKSLIHSAIVKKYLASNKVEQIIRF